MSEREKLLNDIAGYRIFIFLCTTVLIVFSIIIYFYKGKYTNEAAAVVENVQFYRSVYKKKIGKVDEYYYGLSFKGSQGETLRGHFVSAYTKAEVGDTIMITYPDHFESGGHVEIRTNGYYYLLGIIVALDIFLVCVYIKKKRFFVKSF